MYHGVTHEPDRDPRTADKTEELQDVAEKKERVLHTRVPAVLERELKRFADSLRVPVSNLVRTILEDAVKAADVAGEGVENRLKRAAQAIEEKREKLNERLERSIAHVALREAIAFQPVRITRETSCGRCGEKLARGTEAHLAVMPTMDAPRLFVCTTCVPTDEEGETP
jgi:uncharacterized protein with PIN domain